MGNVTKNFENKYIFFISIFNFLILVLYIFNFDLQKTSKLFYIIVFFSFISFFTVSTINFKNEIFNKFKNIQISFFGVIIFFLLLEFLYSLNSKFFPADLRNWISNTESIKKDKKVVQFLSTSPYVKFKPNMNIRSRFYRGNVNQFEYEWVTDKNGFKNLKEVAELEHFDIVVVGDSWAEGMGVATKYTFPSILSRMNYSSYNLGVQGYAPSQMEGVFQNFGKKLNPKFVVITYVMDTYKREKFLKDKKFTGGIGNISEDELNPEIRNQARFVLSGIWLMTKGLRNSIKNTIKSYLNDDLLITDENFKKYKAEIRTINDFYFQNFDQKSWNKTLEAFNNIKIISNEIGAKVVIVYGARRSVIYYNRATNKKIPKNIFIEANRLKEFSESNEILFLNPTQTLVDYVNNLPENFDIKDLPFLEIDGHMNKIGHRIFAEEIYKLMENFKN